MKYRKEYCVARKHGEKTGAHIRATLQYTHLTAPCLWLAAGGWGVVIDIEIQEGMFMT